MQEGDGGAAHNARFVSCSSRALYVTRPSPGIEITTSTSSDEPRNNASSCPTSVVDRGTSFGQLLALFLGSSLLVEVVFSIPGLGRVTYNALIAQDTNLVLGSTLAFTFVAVVGNLLEDLVFTVLDPRISYDDR